MFLSVLSLYGTEDQALDQEKYKEYKVNLPSDTIGAVTDGGCHAGFGNYGSQEGDGIPTITSEEQFRQTTEKIAEIIFKTSD